MPNRTPNLHPNLAVIAAQYDQVTEQYASGKMTAQESQRALARLQARDDNGVVWRLSPETGEWQRRRPDRTWIDAKPPVSGKATMTAWGASSGERIDDPRARVMQRQRKATPPTWWARAQTPLKEPDQKAISEGLSWVLIFMMMCVLVAVVYYFF